VRRTRAATLKRYNDELCEFDTAGRGWARMSKGRADHDVLFEVAGISFVARTPDVVRRDVPTLLVVGAADDKEAIVEPAAAMSSRAQVKPSATTT
jgi:hypothetical protein